MKDEMAQEGYIKCHKNLKNYKPDKGKIFTYLTYCCWSAFVSYLDKHYKQMNLKRQLLLDALEDAQTSTQTPTKQELIKDLERTIAQYDIDADE